jgi:quercetin dioxygenase-like cupin family protein
MIIIDPIKDEENFAYSTIVTYPKTTQISHGVYDNVVDMMNMTTMIKTNIVERNVTNVKGGKTDWTFFNDTPEFGRFLDYIVKKYQNINPLFTKNKWYTNKPEIQAWGNELVKGEHVQMHTHPCHHVILYLTEGSPLFVPELKITIKPQVGSYYIFEPYILHGVPEVTDDSTRYNLVANITQDPDWEKVKDLYIKDAGQPRSE